jgi:hypothetical protein
MNPLVFEARRLLLFLLTIFTNFILRIGFAIGGKIYILGLLLPKILLIYFLFLILSFEMKAVLAHIIFLLISQVKLHLQN